MSDLDFALRLDSLPLLKEGLKNIDIVNFVFEEYLYNADNLLIRACRYGSIKCVHYLLLHIDVNKTTKHNFFALYAASEEGHHEIVDLLLRCKNIIVDQNIYYDQTPLWIACSRGHYEVVLLLIKNNANVNKYDCIYHTPLLIAVEKNEYKIASLLISNGADVNFAYRKYNAPLCAARTNQMKKLLINNGANIDDDALSGMGPFSKNIIINIAKYEKVKKIMSLLILMREVACCDLLRQLPLDIFKYLLEEAEIMAFKE